jgi:hypothetical protein
VYRIDVIRNGLKQYDLPNRASQMAIEAKGKRDQEDQEIVRALDELLANRQQEAVVDAGRVQVLAEEEAGRVRRLAALEAARLENVVVSRQDEGKVLVGRLKTQQETRRQQDNAEQFRLWSAAIMMLFVGNLIPFINDYPDLHYIGSAILVIGGAVLSLISDRRCEPKMHKIIVKWVVVKEDATLAIVFLSVVGYVFNLWAHWGA